MTVYGNRIHISSAADLERLLVLPASLAGWFNPARGHGEVIFPSPHAALAAWRSL